MQAVIFAAGKSTRTYPLTLTKPKPLLKVANIPIIEFNLRQLQGLVDEVIIVVGYKKEMLQKYLGDSYGDLTITYVTQQKLEGTGSALLAAKDHIESKFVCMVADDFYAKDDIEKCLKHTYCILVRQTDELSRFGEVVVDGRKVIGITEKPAKDRGLANTGLMVLDKKVFSYDVEKSPRGEYELTDYISSLAKDALVQYETVEKFWIPVSYPWNILDANSYFLERIHEQILGVVEQGAVIKGPVVIGKKTIVKAGSYIEGPVVIGEECTIGPNCYIRPSTSIGSRCKIGNAVEVKNSVVGDDTSIGHLSYIGDSVIGQGVNFGAGTITANLRHDKKNISTPIKGQMVDTGRKKLGAIVADNVSTGIHTSIYPGRKIWPGKTTEPQEKVDKDIGE